MSGMVWNAIQMVVSQGFTLLIRMVLAKLLFPEQFGIVGMALVFTNLVQMFNDIGIGAALVQKKEEELTENHYHTAFWTGVIWSVALYLIMAFLLGPFAAHFYEQPILASIIPIISIGILSSPVNLVQQAMLTKKMNFKRIAVINNYATIFSGVLSLALAFLGAGIWALVFNAVASFVITMPMFFRATGWRPKMVWNKQAFKEIFGFGAYTTGTNVVSYLMNNVDYFLIGKLLSAVPLGIYTLAFVLTDTFRGKLMAVINNVMYPLYSKKQDDPASVKKYYLKVIEYNSLVVYPIMLFFMVYGESFILNFFGEKWTDTIVPLKILSGSVMLHMLVNSNTVLIRGLGKAGLEMKLQLFKACIFIPTLSIGIYYYGIVGAAWAVLINKFIAVLIAQYTFNYLLNIKMKVGEFLSCVKVPFIATFVALAISLSLYKFQLHYIWGGLVIAASYGTTVWTMMKDDIVKQLKDLKKLKK
ncbi:lipopolysaccharide biosynthesis protein [Paraflavitalea pollutisoli]|uniref:lipopolysaccharide biosynthesis protein n=1 Tax=Paraflavitalea pollutisoli TaxID=3034143 RepID=UPI0023EA8DCA|nr:lipopolysaccharide biosynthesis protein [Paraflavitalea sp. H1-2-19X]